MYIIIDILNIQVENEYFEYFFSKKKKITDADDTPASVNIYVNNSLGISIAIRLYPAALGCR